MNATLRNIGPRLPAAIAGLAGAGIISIGARFLLDPSNAARDFGVPISPEDVGPYLAVKGVRDITSGLVPLAVLAAGQRQTLGWALLAAAFTPLSDMLIVLRNGGAPAAAFRIHGLTAVVLVADAVVLIRETPRR